MPSIRPQRNNSHSLVLLLPDLISISQNGDCVFGTKQLEAVATSRDVLLTLEVLVVLRIHLGGLTNQTDKRKSHARRSREEQIRLRSRSSHSTNSLSNAAF